MKINYTYCFALILSFVFIFPSHLIAAPKVKRKPGVVLKQEGYYCIIDNKDKVMIKPTTIIAEAAAVGKGYQSAQDHFKTTCPAAPPQQVNPHVLQPSQVVNFDFSFHFPNDEALTSQITYSRGAYKMTLSCDNGADTAAESDVVGDYISIGSSRNIAAVTFDVINPLTSRILIQDRGGDINYCTSGKVILERLS